VLLGLNYGKSLSSRILSSSDPTAPEDPKIATFNGLFGKKGDFLTIQIEKL
jgi:hypothetical protein